jgi:hypothetical protein
MPLLPCEILAVVIPIIAWIFGLSVNEKALIAIALSSLVVTAFGVALIFGLVSLIFFPSASQNPPPPHSYPGAALLFLLGVLIGAGIEMLGGLLTLAACCIGLRQTAHGRPRWFWILLAGALLPLIVFVGIGVFAQAGQDMLGRVSPQIHGISLLLMIAVVLPLVAAIVTTTYASNTARTWSAWASNRHPLSYIE